MRILLLALLACSLGAGCKKKKPSYDRSTPVATINAFRQALEAGRIPEDTGDFFLSPGEKVSWKLRCRERGCNRATFKILEVVSEDDYAAKYMVDYSVYGAGNRRIMSGQNTPITFAFHDGGWLFDQIGVVHTIKLGVPVDAGPADALTSGDAANAAE